MTRLQHIVIISTILVHLTIKINGQQARTTTLCGKRLVRQMPLILSGHPTSEGDWPWHAAIFHYSKQTIQYKCGGTVLNENTVLTAAHCVFENNQPIIAERVKVHLGKHNLITAGSHTQEFSVIHLRRSSFRVIPHHSYNTTTLSDDIAIIQLETKATFTDYVQPVCLWDPNNVDTSELTGKFGTVVGWGLTDTNKLADILRQAVLPVVSLTTCLNSNPNVFGSLLTDNNFCAGYQNGTSACLGDSGGGLTFKDNGLYYIRGIVSLTALTIRDNTQSCSSEDFVLFTDVAKYSSWMELTVPQLHPSQKSGQVIFQLSGNVMWSSNCDFYGGDFKNQMSRRKDCGDICDDNKVCTHFSWVPSKRNSLGVCLLKNIGNNPLATVNNNVLCGYIIRHSASRLFDFHTFGSARWSLNCGFNGSDIGNQKSSSTDCATLCEERGDCTHFNWTPYQHGTCWLKGPGTITSPNYINSKNVLCGFFVSDWKIFGNIRWNHNCDFRGDDITTQKFSRNACKEWCSRREDCHKFTWLPLEGGTCFLNGKHARITSSKNNGIICGWVKRE